jgi:aryl-alcohol dehydrogenase-like predicted oxidoreductase
LLDLEIIPNILEPQDLKRHALNEAVDNSLKRLQTDYIDLYQLHWPERNTNKFGKRGYKYHKNEKWKDNFKEVLHT